MKFNTSLYKGKFIKRYKRFFVDVAINGKVVTAHCPNTGSMTGLLNKNNNVWVSHNNNPNRKLKYTLELIKVNETLFGINTHRANRIVEHGLKNKLIREFNNTKNIKAEFKYSDDTRFDFLCDKKILEVKNTTLVREDDIAEFPDAVTARGAKHLKKLIESTKKGFQPYVLFLTQIQGINKFKIAKDIDTNYFNEYLEAKTSGVKFLAYRCSLNSKEIKIEKKIKILND